MIEDVEIICEDRDFRGHLCPYHQGYLEGFTDAQEENDDSTV
jgi:hypothetical protein